MCGIVGTASTRRTGADWLIEGREAVRHRGPDGTGAWTSQDGRVHLGHRRLAIIDLSNGGRQPMLGSNGRDCIAFNGEIYSFRELRKRLEERGLAFRTQSDTEVILASYRVWGRDFLPRLAGMFAFALYDASREELILARDRAGEKPLFYRIEGGEIRFASELKGLLADRDFPRRIDPAALDCYLAAGFVPGDRCILQGVRKLPPAHALAFSLRTGTAEVWRYWRPPGPPATSPESPAAEEELLGELESLMDQAVRRQLVSDVPVGVLLSGGVDSSLVTAMAARNRTGIKTFTVRFPGYGTYDETEHARLISRSFGTEHTELEAEAADVGILEVLARQFDEPVTDSSMVPASLVSSLVRNHCTVVLGGDGGDELFGGYSHYDRLLKLRERVARFPLILRRLIAKAAGDCLPIGFKGRNWLLAAGADFEREVPLVASYFDARSRRRIAPGMREGASAYEAIHLARTPREGDFLYRACLMDFENYLPEDILVKMDRASMLHSLEVRAPFLDMELVEFAIGKIPSSLKATSTERKILLKKLAQRILPPEFDRRRKQGFMIPLASWLKEQGWMHFFRDVLLDASQSVFDHAFIERLLAGQARGRVNEERLFGLVMFELWRREYRAAI